LKKIYKELEDMGQSVWLDNISRDALNKKVLEGLMDEIGLKGVTSNPSIFQKAIAAGNAYDQQINEIIDQNPDISVDELFEKLAVSDIQRACDVLSPVYKNTNGNDGFVSIEVAPNLAFNYDATIKETRKLWKLVNRPNLMVKIPATQEGLPAIREAIAEGININITLIFSRDVYQQVAEAYISGLEDRVSKGEKIDNISSVASFFVSRIDTLTDKLLDEKGNKDLQGKAAVANAKLAYLIYKDMFFSERFKKLQAKGARLQRLLWASTSTKNPAYPDTIYIDELIGKNTVNTMPPATIDAFGDHGKVKNALETDVNEAKDIMNKIKSAGVDFKYVTDKLTEDGVKSFEKSFEELLEDIQKKKEAMELKK
jgi:transaldolase